MVNKYSSSVRMYPRNKNEKFLQDEAGSLFHEVLSRTTKVIETVVRDTNGAISVESAVSTMAFILLEVEQSLFSALEETISAEKFAYVKKVYDETSKAEFELRHKRKSGGADVN